MLKPASCGICGKQNATNPAAILCCTECPRARNPTIFGSGFTTALWRQCCHHLHVVNDMKWETVRWGSNCPRKKDRMCISVCFAPKPGSSHSTNAKGARNMNVAWVSPEPSTSLVSGGLTLAINPFTGLFRECFSPLLHHLHLLFHVSYPWCELHLKSTALPVHPPCSSQFPNVRQVGALPCLKSSLHLGWNGQHTAYHIPGDLQRPWHHPPFPASSPVSLFLDCLLASSQEEASAFLKAMALTHLKPSHTTKMPAPEHCFPHATALQAIYG